MPSTVIAKLKPKDGHEEDVAASCRRLVAFGERQDAVVEAWELFTGEKV